jgi:hypothetical protein
VTRYVFAALALAAAFPARAGVVLQFADADKKITTVEMEGKKLRSHSQDGQQHGGSAIFDGDKQVFYSLDDEKKTYHRMDEASGAAMATQMHDAMEKAKARMTPEQRAQMEALVANRQPHASNAAQKQHTWKFERESGGQKVAGYSCDNYRVLRDGKPHSEVCFVPWSAGGFSKSDFAALQEMGRFFEKTFASMSGRHANGAPQVRSGEWVTQFVENAPGFPAVMDRIDADGKRTQETRLVKIDRMSLAANRFSPPADYREASRGQ